MILDSFLRIIQIWTRNSASHLSMEVVGEKTRIKNWWFCFSLKDEFSSAKQSRTFFFSNFESRRFFYFPKEIAPSNIKKKFSSRIKEKNFSFEEFWNWKNFELKIVHNFYTQKYLLMFRTVFLDKVLLLVCLYPKQSFCLKIVDECKHPRIQARDCWLTQHKII